MRIEINGGTLPDDGRFVKWKVFGDDVWREGVYARGLFIYNDQKVREGGDGPGVVEEWEYDGDDREASKREDQEPLDVPSMMRDIDDANRISGILLGLGRKSYKLTGKYPYEFPFSPARHYFFGGDPVAENPRGSGEGMFAKMRPLYEKLEELWRDFGADFDKEGPSYTAEDFEFLTQDQKKELYKKFGNQKHSSSFFKPEGWEVPDWGVIHTPGGLHIEDYWRNLRADIDKMNKAIDDFKVASELDVEHKELSKEFSVVCSRLIDEVRMEFVIDLAAEFLSSIRKRIPEAHGSIVAVGLLRKLNNINKP